MLQLQLIMSSNTHPQVSKKKWPCSSWFLNWSSQYFPGLERVLEQAEIITNSSTSLRNMIAIPTRSTRMLIEPLFKDSCDISFGKRTDTLSLGIIISCVGFNVHRDIYVWVSEGFDLVLCACCLSSCCGQWRCGESGWWSHTNMCFITEKKTLQRHQLMAQIIFLTIEITHHCRPV